MGGAVDGFAGRVALAVGALVVVFHQLQPGGIHHTELPHHCRAALRVLAHGLALRLGQRAVLASHVVVGACHGDGQRQGRSLQWMVFGL